MLESEAERVESYSLGYPYEPDVLDSDDFEYGDDYDYEDCE